MRTLVDQTAREVRRWLGRLHDRGVDADGLLPRAEDVHILMGGADSGRWFENPERPGVVVGTQDMLLSRALMRGYASSRASWPMEFAVLHQDCQLVFDEVQLIERGPGHVGATGGLPAVRVQEGAARGPFPDPGQ